MSSTISGVFFLLCLHSAHGQHSCCVISNCYYDFPYTGLAPTYPRYLLVSHTAGPFIVLRMPCMLCIHVLYSTYGLCAHERAEFAFMQNGCRVESCFMACLALACTSVELSVAMAISTTTPLIKNGL